MKLLRLLLSGSLVALATLLPCSAQQKPAYSDTDAGQHAGEEATVTGKVAAVSKSAKGTAYLNFGDRFPKQTFTGVVFAGDAENVGDLKQFEGKTVTLTGRIELSSEQKPQIVVKSAEQLKLADGTPAPAPVAAAKPSAPAAPAPAAATPAPVPPMPTAVATPAPTAVAALSTKPAAAAKKIALAANWNSPTQGGDMTRKDLAMLFGTASGKADDESAIVIYPDIPYLAPLAAAKKALNLETSATSKTKVTCPGMPLGSFSAYAFAGIFPGGFNRLYLVTDNADQVISVLLVDENSRQRSTTVTDNAGYHTYNFINFRVKGTNDLVIKHDLATDAPAGVVLVESLLIDPKDSENTPKSGSSKGPSSSKSSTSSTRTPRTGKVLERSHWYVPVPVVNLILRCVGSR